ncbi:unnamed protein product [Paramecium sonneborni]|uniref:Uncharacterized protein n=1 Tax=Paramecium sonneborni TaxID=65129 RepID=A0A8S1QNU0_9CILI|nr:unnamed protein product [Paramecium sonneborni]
MRIIAMYLLKYHPENPIFISSHYELSFVNWFQRPFFKETLNFGARTCAARAKPGTKSAVTNQDAHVVSYICIDKNNLAALVIADDQYPEKVAFMVIQNMYQEYYRQYNSMFLDTIIADQNINIPKFEEFIKVYQDPKEVDKLLKIENTLNEVTMIVHQSLDDLLKRGETLESLMAKSKDMSSVSLDFYKNAKKTNNKCCSLY